VIFPHSPRRRTSWCCKFWNCQGRFAWYASPWVDETGFDHRRDGYASVYGWGNSWISLLEAATNFLKDFNMSATMATQGGRVQLEQSDMRLALNMAKMAIWFLLSATIKETQYLIKKPRADVREEKKLGVELPGHNKVKATRERHLAMFRQIFIARCLPCQNRTSKNLQSGWRRKPTSAPRPDWRRLRTPEPTPPPPRMPPVPIGNNSGTQCSQINNLLAGYVSSHTSHHCTVFCSLDASAQDSQHDTDFDPDMLTDEGSLTG